MQTPHLPRAIFGDDFQNVYEPAEDTFLLLDALENDLDTIRENVIICLECGSGSGTVITALSMALTKYHQASIPLLMFATDINIEACKTTKKSATYHQQVNIQVIRTNLAQSLVDRLDHSVDLLVFNPPYVPTDSTETLANSEQIQHSWAGGASGRKLIDQFLNSYLPRLLSKPNGMAYMVALDQNNIDELTNHLLEDYNIKGEIVLKRKAGIELLYIIKYCWVSPS